MQFSSNRLLRTVSRKARWRAWQSRIEIVSTVITRRRDNTPLYTRYLPGTAVSLVGHERLPRTWGRRFHGSETGEVERPPGTPEEKGQRRVENHKAFLSLRVAVNNASLEVAHSTNDDEQTSVDDEKHT